MAELNPSNSHVRIGDFVVLLTNVKGASLDEWQKLACLLQAAPDLLAQLEALVTQIKASNHLVVPPLATAVIARAKGFGPMHRTLTMPYRVLADSKRGADYKDGDSRTILYDGETEPILQVFRGSTGSGGWCDEE